MLNCRVVKIVKFSGSLNMLNCRVVKHVKMVKVSGALNMLNCRVVGQHLVKPSRLYGRPNIWNILLRGIIPKIMKFWCQLEESHLEASWYYREWHIKTTIRELAIYLMFICLIVFRELKDHVLTTFLFSFQSVLAPPPAIGFSTKILWKSISRMWRRSNRWKFQYKTPTNLPK